MRLLTPPGVFRPRSDSWLLADAVGHMTRRRPRRRRLHGQRRRRHQRGAGRRESRPRHRSLTARGDDRPRQRQAQRRPHPGTARRPARPRSRSAVRPHRLEPPYLPDTAEPARGAARAWEGGLDGRASSTGCSTSPPPTWRQAARGCSSTRRCATLTSRASACTPPASSTRSCCAGVVRWDPCSPHALPPWRPRGLLRPGEREEELAILRAIRAEPAQMRHIS